MIDNAKDLREYCEKLFVSTSPHVNKDEARCGVLGYHPLALLVIALDVITDLEKQLEESTHELDRLHKFVNAEMQDIHDVICPDCVTKLLHKNGYTDADIEAFIVRIRKKISGMTSKHRNDTVGTEPDKKGRQDEQGT